MENEQNNTWQAWATGKLAMSVLGLAVGIYIYRSGIVQTLTNKLFTKTND